MAELLQLKTHQRVLINKQKKYQVQELSKVGEEDEGSGLKGSAIERFTSVNESEELFDEEGKQFQQYLTTSYFEKALLDEDQKNIDQLLADFDPGSDAKDLLLMEGITGFKAKLADE